MRFIVIGRDGNDNQAQERRVASRAAHLKLGDDYIAKGQHLMAVALLDDQDKMIGSVMLVDFPSRKELDDWLKIEPYVHSGVWKDIEILPAKVGPSFERIFSQ